jgi:putative ABC transport system ATP-binding protein
METLSPIYRAQGVVKQYPIGDRVIEILHGIDLDISPGEFVLLIGPSGCGKSTFMYLLFGLEAPSKGKVTFDGTDVFSLSDDARTNLRSRSISMIHQQPIWIKSLTVRENIAFPLTLQQVNRIDALKKADRLLSTLHLDKLASHHPHELSVGEQQRCSFMRSLITDPKVIFADEPTGSLDTDSSIVVMELFRKINADLGKTVIMVTHNMSHLPYGSKIVSMLDGRITNVDLKRPPSASQENRSIVDVISTWHEKEHQESPAPAAEPRLTPKPTIQGEKTSTTQTRLAADIVKAQERAAKK